MANSPNEMAIFERVAARGSFAAQPSVTATEQVSTRTVSIVSQIIAVSQSGSHAGSKGAPSVDLLLSHSGAASRPPPDAERRASRRA